MSKYQNLSDHLSAYPNKKWRTSFDELEKLLGFPLPKSAYKYQAWWSNQTGQAHAQSEAWQTVGWRTGELDLDNKTVSFFRKEKSSIIPDKSSEPSAKTNSTIDAMARTLTISEAKAALARHFGVSAESVEIIIKG